MSRIVAVPNRERAAVRFCCLLHSGFVSANREAGVTPNRHAKMLGGRPIGRTSDSESDYPGSSPGLPAKFIFPVKTLYKGLTAPAKRADTRLRLESLEDRTLLSVNPIVAENLLPGTPQSVWDVSGAGVIRCGLRPQQRDLDRLACSS